MFFPFSREREKMPEGQMRVRLFVEDALMRCNDVVA